MFSEWIRNSDWSFCDLDLGFASSIDLFTMGCDGLHRAHLCCAYPWEPFWWAQGVSCLCRGRGAVRGQRKRSCPDEIAPGQWLWDGVSVAVFGCVWHVDFGIRFSLFYLVLRGKKCNGTNGMGNDVELVFKGSTANCEWKKLPGVTLVQPSAAAMSRTRAPVRGGLLVLALLWCCCLLPTFLGGFGEEEKKGPPAKPEEGQAEEKQEEVDWKELAYQKQQERSFIEWRIESLCGLCAVGFSLYCLLYFQFSGCPILIDAVWILDFLLEQMFSLHSKCILSLGSP